MHRWGRSSALEEGGRRAAPHGIGARGGGPGGGPAGSPLPIQFSSSPILHSVIIPSVGLIFTFGAALHYSGPGAPHTSLVRM